MKMDMHWMSIAAENGHLNVLQWARAHGCEWGTTTCRRAAKKGQYDIVEWELANGCPWVEWTRTFDGPTMGSS
jgi:hypothetical protein